LLAWQERGFGAWRAFPAENPGKRIVVTVGCEPGYWLRARMVAVLGVFADSNADGVHPVKECRASGGECRPLPQPRDAGYASTSHRLIVPSISANGHNRRCTQ
jgi:hypothetical protein